MLTESISTAVLIAGLTLLVSCISNSSSWQVWGIAGLFVLFATFIRSQIFLVTLALSCAVIAIALIGLRYRGIQFRNISLGRSFSFIVFIWFPLGVGLFWNDGKLFDVSYAYQYAFLLDPFIKSAPGDFLNAGGFASACAADLENCERVRHLINAVPGMSANDIGGQIVKALVFNPGSFLSYKLPIAWDYWNAERGYISALIRLEYFFSSLFLLFGMVATVRFLLLRQWLILLLSLSCIFLTIIPMLMFHFEVRYFFLPKALLFVMLLWSFSLSTLGKSGQEILL